VKPGDVIHMDEHGAVKFPADKLKEVCEHIDAFSIQEDLQANALLAAKNVEEIKDAWAKRV
jgi:4-hydroxy-4-methyl-2-oxoglutarate aldolase